MYYLNENVVYMVLLWNYTKGNKQSDLKYNFRQVLIITISFLLNGFTVYLYLVHQLPILAINNGRQTGLHESMIQSSGEICTAMIDAQIKASLF